MPISIRWLIAVALYFTMGCARVENQQSHNNSATSSVENTPTPAAIAILTERNQNLLKDFERLQAQVRLQLAEGEQAKAGLERLHAETLEMQRTNSRLLLDKERLQNEVRTVEQRQKHLQIELAAAEDRLANLRERHLEAVQKQENDSRNESSQLHGQIAHTRDRLPKAVPLHREMGKVGSSCKSEATGMSSRSVLRQRLREELKDRAVEMGYKLIENGRGDYSAPVHIIRRAIASNGYETFHYPPDSVDARVFVKLWMDAATRRMYYKIE